MKLHQGLLNCVQDLMQLVTRENEGLIICSQLFLNFLFISLVPIIGIFGGAVVPLYKGMMSETVDPDERGQYSLYYRVIAHKCPVSSMSGACRGPWDQQLYLSSWTGYLL